MRILITGATGFIGNAVAKKLSQKHEMWCTLRKSSDKSKLENIECKVVFVDERQMLYEKFEAIRPELVIHFAGIFLSEHCNDNIAEMIDSNIDFPTILFDAAYESGCRQFINTASCWQNYQGEEYNPVNLYAATKQAVEDILQYYVRAKDAKVITLSIFDSFGPNDSRNKVLNIVSRLGNGDSIEMSGGEQKMYLCYIEDIVSAYIQAINLLNNMKAGEYEKYAVRDERAYSLKEIVSIYLLYSGKHINIQWGAREYRNREIMNPSGWGKVIPGWKVRYPLEEGMKFYISGNEE